MKILVQLQPGQRSETAVRAILVEQLEALVSTVPGVVEGHDIEFLHDFRVASRRTRSALTQLKCVLDRQAVHPFLVDFKWLGEVTGPCRDLDVHLDDLEDVQGWVDIPPSLENRVRVARGEAHRHVVRAINSARFTVLVERWRTFLERPAHGTVPAKALTPVEDLAGTRILKAYSRVLRRGGELDPRPCAAGMHRTRIEAKKLRYLLEFFKSLYPLDRITPLVHELKAFQDILGGFQDAEVQDGRWLEVGRALKEDDEMDSATEKALGELTALLADRQNCFRGQFHARFQDFASAASRAVYHSVFGYNSGHGGNTE